MYDKSSASQPSHSIPYRVIRQPGPNRKLAASHLPSHRSFSRTRYNAVCSNLQIYLYYPSCVDTPTSSRNKRVLVVSRGNGARVGGHTESTSVLIDYHTLGDFHSFTFFLSSVSSYNKVGYFFFLSKPPSTLQCSNDDTMQSKLGITVSFINFGYNFIFARAHIIHRSSLAMLIIPCRLNLEPFSKLRAIPY